MSSNASTAFAQVAYTNGYEFTQVSGYALPEYPFVTPPELASGTVGRHDIVIVGGGITGLTLACGLAARGVRAVLLDERVRLDTIRPEMDAGLSDLLDHVISVDQVRKYKTDPQAYALGEQATGMPAAQIAFVSSNAWDALAATWYGYATVWVNRYQLPFEELDVEPHHSGSDLRAVLQALGPIHP